MISLSSISRDPVLAPPRIVLYGPQKTGKTTFGASAPSAIVVPLEEGIGHLEVDHFPLLGSFADAMQALASLRDETHDYKTVVVDSMDWLEPLLWQYTSGRHGKTSIEDFGYGKGYAEALDDWRQFIGMLNVLRTQKGMACVLIAHADVKRFDDPEHESYDRYQIKLHQRAGALLEEWADCILFINHFVRTEKADVGFNKKVVRGVGSGERRIYTEARPAFKAGNRYSLPPELPCPKDDPWGPFQQALMNSVKPRGNEK